MVIASYYPFLPLSPKKHKIIFRSLEYNDLNGKIYPQIRKGWRSLIVVIIQKIDIPRWLDGGKRESKNNLTRPQIKINLNMKGKAGESSSKSISAIGKQITSANTHDEFHTTIFSLARTPQFQIMLFYIFLTQMYIQRIGVEESLHPTTGDLLQISNRD